MGQPSVDTIWDWLDQVPDPEIPVISLVDLGIIRDVRWEGDTLTVAVTPTYSGCPATSIINIDIETALRDRGIEKLTLTQQLSPPWTTDWLSDKGRAKLEDYGIAPLPRKANQNAAPIAAATIWNAPASSARPHARHSGDAATALNLSTISSASDCIEETQHGALPQPDCDRHPENHPRRGGGDADP